MAGQITFCDLRPMWYSGGMLFTLYHAVHRNTGKRYIGITRHSLEQRRREHGYAARAKKAGMWKMNGLFSRAIRKHGLAAFTFTQVAVYHTADEANAAEIRAIAKFKPALNSTLGGRGQLGRVFTPDALRRIGASAALRTGPRGWSHTAEQRAIFREKALAKIETWETYRAMGPKASSKSVRCVDDGCVYESASAAARAYGVAKSALVELCLGQKGRKTVGGRVFAYEETV